MRIAVLCSGLGHVWRGHESFIRQVFDLLRGHLDITLFKGGGEARPDEVVVDHVPRYSPLLDGMHVACSPKWRDAVREQRRFEVETTTFAYAALRPLLAGGYDVIHCLEKEVAEILYRQRSLFPNRPKILFSNGGALPARRLPPCDFIQEHTEYSLRRGVPAKSFLIPHGIDLALFDPSVESDFRARLGIPDRALLVLSVGAICRSHKRMDYLIEEVARLDGAYLAIAGQRTMDTPGIEELGARRLGQRVRFLQLPHRELPRAYRAADVFVLASLFETFGIAYLEAMAMRLPVVATNHPNQRQILGDAVFVDMRRPGAVSAAVAALDAEARQRLGAAGRARVVRCYDLAKLRQRYVDMYEQIARSAVAPERYSLAQRLRNNLRSWRRR